MITLTCDCCESCSIELHLHKDGLNVTNDCIQDSQALVRMHQGGRTNFFDLFLWVLLCGRFRAQTITSKYSKREYFYPALCIKQIAFCVLF